MFFSRDLPERDRIGGIATERLLVYIDAGSYDAILDTSSYQGVLDEHATDFPVLPVDVVRPFDADVFGVVGQRFADRQCHGLGQDELPVGFHFTGMEEQAEQRFLPASDSQELPACPRPAVWKSAVTRIMSFGETGR